MLTKAGAETEAIAARATAGAVAAAGDDTTPADVFDAVVTDDVVARGTDPTPMATGIAGAVFLSSAGAGVETVTDAETGVEAGACAGAGAVAEAGA